MYFEIVEAGDDEEVNSFSPGCCRFLILCFTFILFLFFLRFSVNLILGIYVYFLSDTLCVCLFSKQKKREFQLIPTSRES